MYKVITIGDPLVDTHIKIDHGDSEWTLEDKNQKICLNYGHKIPVSDSFQALGGNAANVAVGLQKLGLKTALLGTIGKDTRGKFILNELKKHKIDTNYITFDKKNETRYSVILNYKGERTILSYSKKKNYNWPKEVPNCEWIYYTSLSKGFEDMQRKMLSHLSKHPTVRLAINPGSFMIKYGLTSIKEIIPKADLLFVNKEEAEKLLGLTRSFSMEGLIQKLTSLGAKEVIITNGEEGSWAGDNENFYFQKPFPVPVVAKTGAGDAFASGYLAGRINNKGIKECLLWGTANSSGLIQKQGAQNGLLNKAGIIKMVEQYKTK